LKQYEISVGYVSRLFYYNRGYVFGPRKSEFYPTILGSSVVISLNWNNHSIGPYTNATIDFGKVKVGGWNPTRAYIAPAKDNTTGCQVTLLPNALSKEGGLIANVPIQEGTEYEVDFDMKFNWNFNWSHGGKVGFGLRIGM
jgi:hypothetical protein